MFLLNLKKRIIVMKALYLSSNLNWLRIDHAMFVLIFIIQMWRRPIKWWRAYPVKYFPMNMYLHYKKYFLLCFGYLILNNLMVDFKHIIHVLRLKLVQIFESFFKIEALLKLFIQSRNRNYCFDKPMNKIKFIFYIVFA